MSSGLEDGQYVHRSFHPGYVVLSFLISCIGASTTLELLHKRTALKGWYNWYLLITSCITMGGIAIWCMHYIGNRAIILGRGEPELQIAYNPAVTAASFFVPVLALIGSFCAAGISEHVSRVSIIISGTLTGLAICGMHYLGQAGIVNYTGVYHVSYIVGSAVVAVVASITAIGIFFVLRAGWTNSWWKRLLCAILLAVGISGMHWVGTMGTDYKFKDLGPTPDGRLSRKGTVVIVLVLSVSTCILLVTIAIIARSQVLRTERKAKQLVLACATFDNQGNLMVTPDGSLPSQKITNSYLEESWEDVFSVSHETFRWIFRATHNWRAVAGLVPGLRIHSRAITAAMATRTHASNPENMVEAENYSLIFKELFCVAAQDLAEQIHEPLEDIGVMYDEIMSTGTIEQAKSNRVSFLSTKSISSPDIEQGRTSFTFGRGQLLFLVRLANKAEAARLQASGFRFADVRNIADPLAKRMQVGREELFAYVDGMWEYSKQNRILEPGVYMTCFALRPLLRGSFDILVRKNATNLLPSVRLQRDQLSSSDLEFLGKMEGWTVAACLKWLRSPMNLTSRNGQPFISQFYDSLTALVEHIEHPFFLEARFVGHPVSTPCQGQGDDQAVGKASILAFHVIADVHSSTPNSRLIFSPYSFFKCQQTVLTNAPGHENFNSVIHRDFAPLLDAKLPLCNTARHSVPSSSNLARDIITRNPISQKINRSWTFSSRAATLDVLRGDDSSEKNLVAGAASQAYGGITVRNDVRVEISQMARGGSVTDVELKPIHNRKGSNPSAAERETFFDELFALTVDSNRR